MSIYSMQALTILYIVIRSPLPFPSAVLHMLGPLVPAPPL
ncbi:hypothetical protein E2C01_092135 [Portunus trituberculatus]|uniref:Uncharacterized protein n=1 Tax=Portunus trituberculatus TaxID=210409 RepID=A0A5B7JR89_PORTR|nr:hypothetical protein [Portunus trituberculatus]